MANDEKWQNIKITSVKKISVQPNNVGKIHFKYNYEENFSTCIIIGSKKCLKNYPLNKLHKAQIQLDANKKKDLQSMCDSGVIPQEHHSYYQELLG